MFNDFTIGIILSLLLGALIGTQREIRKQKDHAKDFAGFRTFAFVSLLGFLLGHLSFNILKENFIIVISLFNIFVISAVTYYVISKTDPKEIAATTQMTFILTFVLGIFISLKYYQSTITLAIIIASLLVLGDKIHSIARHLKKQEVFATLKFSIISLIILPLLPDVNYTPLDFPIIGDLLQQQTTISLTLLQNLDVFNFYNMWLMVVFISGIGFIGYFLMKTIGAQKGILITGFLGGFMSSTALAITFSQQSRKHKDLSSPLAIGVIVACSTMFFRIIFEIIILNKELLYGTLIPLGSMGMAGFLLAFYLLYKNNKTAPKYIKKQKFTSPFTFTPAFEFALLYLLISFFSKLFTLINGANGIYILSFISGITDVDAITISLSTLALKSSIPQNVAEVGIVIASISNTIFKASIAYYLGSKKFHEKIFLVFSFIIFIGGICLLF